MSYSSIGRSRPARVLIRRVYLGRTPTHGLSGTNLFVGADSMHRTQNFALQPVARP